MHRVSPQRHHTSVQELNLSFGEITLEAALVVAQAVKDKTHMQSLDLNGRRTIEVVDHSQDSKAFTEKPKLMLVCWDIFVWPEQVTASVRAAARLWKKPWRTCRTPTSWHHSGGFFFFFWSACTCKTSNKLVSFEILFKVRSEFNDELFNHSDDEGEPEDDDDEDEEEEDDDDDDNSDGGEKGGREECNKDDEDTDVTEENGITETTGLSPEKAQSPVRQHSRDPELCFTL